MHAAGDNLLQVLGLLVAADPERGGVVLRKAIASLVADDIRPLGRVPAKDPIGWARRSEHNCARPMSVDGLTAMQLATELGLSESAIDKCAAPNGPVPSTAIIAKIRNWLAARESSVAAASPVKKTAPANNGATKPAGNGADSRAAFRLTRQECDRLFSHISRWLEGDCRRELGMTLEVAKRVAAAGQTEPAEIVERVRTFLDGGGVQ
jgi:hypothetical protein